MIFGKDHEGWIGISIEEGAIRRRQVDDKLAVWGRENSNEQKKRRHTNQVQKFSSGKVWLDFSMPRAKERE